jgi:lincosamide nucleotidyltransferase A/C/D/E
VVTRLRRASVDFWIEGGWGVDALLGEETRPHDDLDIGVRLDDLPRLEKALAEFRRSDAEWPSAIVYEDAARGRVDAHPLLFDAEGDGWQANASGLSPHKWPRNGLRGRGRIAGVEVPCITAELQLRWHVYPEFDDIDWRDVQLVGERFGLEPPEQCRERPGFVAPKRRRARSAAGDV